MLGREAIAKEMQDLLHEVFEDETILYFQLNIVKVYKVDRLLSDNSILHDNSKLRVTIIKNYSMIKMRYSFNSNFKGSSLLTWSRLAS